MVKIMPNRNLRRCVYAEDGEFEDLRVVDIVQLAKLDNQSKKKCIKGSRSPATNHKASLLAKKRTYIKMTSALTKMIKFQSITWPTREIAMEKLASYLGECGGMYLIISIG